MQVSSDLGCVWLRQCCTAALGTLSPSPEIRHSKTKTHTLNISERRALNLQPPTLNPLEILNPGILQPAQNNTPENSTGLAGARPLRQLFPLPETLLKVLQSLIQPLGPLYGP